MSASNARREAFWQSIALRKGIVARLLWPLSIIYRTLVAARRHLYATGRWSIHRLPVPVVVVGNVVVGGAGKTPTVLALIRHLQATGWRPGIVSRGHGRRGSADTLEVRPDTPAALSGDEPALLRRQTGVPVYVASQRVDAARALLAAHPGTDVIVCDDGLQHWALGRDVAIAVFDDRGVGNGWLLPAGLLRDRWPLPHSTLGAPDLVLQQRRADQRSPSIAPEGMPAFQAQRKLANEILGPNGERALLSDLRSRPLTAVVGIARPNVFFDMLRHRGLELQEAIALPDHAASEDYEAVLARTSNTLICTEKDAVKLFGLPAPAGLRIWSVALELDVDPALFEAVEAQLAKRGHRPPAQ